MDYRHWEVEGAEMDVEGELARAVELAEGLGDYVVVAKSIGMVLATLANARGLIAPKACVFMGFPLRPAQELPQALELAVAFKNLPPTVFLHNENDPLGTAEAVREYIERNAPADYEFQITPGDTHDYADFKLVATLAARE